MKEKIYEIIAEISENDIEDINDSYSLIDDLEMDSLMMIDLIVKLEKIIGKSIKAERISTLKMVSDILQLVEEKQ